MSLLLEKLRELANPQFFVSESPVEFSGAWIGPNNNSFFEDRWNYQHDEKLHQLIYYCGEAWVNYAFDLFYEDFQSLETEYYIHTYLSRKSRTIMEYFNENKQEIFFPRLNSYPKTWTTVLKELPPTLRQVNERFYYDLSDYILSRGLNTIRASGNRVVQRTRISKVTGTPFYGASRSISFSNRTIVEWDIQNYVVEISQSEFDPFIRIGSDDDVKRSIDSLRQLLDFIGFIPEKNSSVYSIYRNIPREKYIEFNLLARKTFFPIRYANVFGDWLGAVVATGYLGPSGIRKTEYGYKVHALDGHVCNSLAEKVVDDWLFKNGVEHVKEPTYPVEARELLGSKVRADWQLENEIYVEYFGLQDRKDYAEKTSAKMAACRVLGISLIALFPGDEFRLGKIFKEFGITSSST